MEDPEVMKLTDPKTHEQVRCERCGFQFFTKKGSHWECCNCDDLIHQSMVYSEPHRVIVTLNPEEEG